MILLKEKVWVQLEPAIKVTESLDQFVRRLLRIASVTFVFALVCVIERMVLFFLSVNTAPDGGLASDELRRCIAHPQH